jgi:hypothetical protein
MHAVVVVIIIVIDAHIIFLVLLQVTILLLVLLILPISEQFSITSQCLSLVFLYCLTTVCCYIYVSVPLLQVNDVRFNEPFTTNR